MDENRHGGNIYYAEMITGIPASGIIDFSVNLNPLGTPAELKNIIRDSLDEIMYYPDPAYTASRSAIAAYHRVPIEYITTGNGATEIISLVCRVLKPAKALIVAPSYSEYGRALKNTDAEISYFRLRDEDGYKADIAALMTELSGGYDLAVVCNPNNPTGALISKDEILSLSEHCAESGCMLMIDESFMEFCFEGGNINSIIGPEMPQNIFAVRSLTKILSMPGLRIGYGVSSDNILNRKIAEYREPWTVSIPAAKAAEFLPKCSEFFERTRQTVSEENWFIKQRIGSIAWLKSYSSSVNFILLKILNAMTSHEVSEILLRKGIPVRDASNFIYLNEKYIRVAVKDRESNTALIDALNDIM